MADRYFVNELPEADEVADEASAAAGDGVVRLLSIPSRDLDNKFLRAALQIKDKVVKETWVQTRRQVHDYTLYTGALGTAFLLFKTYLVTKDQKDLALASDIISACDAMSSGVPFFTFICGRAGVCALGAIVAHHMGDGALVVYYLKAFAEIKITGHVYNELLYGRAGYLWAYFFLGKYFDNNTLSLIDNETVVNDIISEGRKLSHQGRCPLVYEWHDKRYWGAAHGLAGITHVLMHTELKDDEARDVKGTLRYMIKNRFPSGNYLSSEGNTNDRLVHWCHGAPGVALTLAKAYQVFQEDDFLQAAKEAGEVVWNRGLLRRVGLCHGISGNTYTFLALYRATTNPEYLHRAKAFACFLLDSADDLIADGAMHGGDRPYSMFEGKAGMAHLFLDMLQPLQARFPGYEL